MPESVIAFDGVWKKFRRGEHHDSLRDLVPALVRRFVARREEPALDADEFWVLRNVLGLLLNRMTATAMDQLLRDAFAKVQRFSADWHANAFAGATPELYAIVIIDDVEILYYNKQYFDTTPKTWDDIARIAAAKSKPGSLAGWSGQEGHGGEGSDRAHSQGIRSTRWYVYPLRSERGGADQ